MDCGMPDRPAPPPRWRRIVALSLFLAAGLFFLWTEHRAHLFGALPYILVLACPMAHLFLHGGHGRDRGKP